MDLAGLNARNTPACQSNPREGGLTLSRASTHTHACINIQCVCVCAYVQTPSLVADCYAVPRCSGPSRFRDRDCYYSPADSTHTHTDGRAAWNALNNRGTTRIQQHGEAVNSGGDTNMENNNSSAYGNLGSFDFTQA